MRTLFLLMLVSFISNTTIAQKKTDDISKEASTYNVVRLKQTMKIDGEWNKPQWKKVRAIDITHYMGDLPRFRPSVQAKMMYDDDNVYIIFRVKDRYVRSIAKDIGGQVWKDSAVEFFFAPDTSSPLDYFNLEVNCGGTPLLGYRGNKPTVTDIQTIEIAHSLPRITDPEIAKPVTWTIEYRIPLAMLEKYSSLTRPKHGVIWKGNFYKIAENTSNPHYITWNVVENDKPNFHLPQFFGTLQFQ